VSFDLASCFDQVTCKKLKSVGLPDEIISQVTYDGAARQGFPTSPACADLALGPLDRAIFKAIRKSKKGIIYTRYVDDLTFSCDSEEVAQWLLARIPQTVRRCGWRLNDAKTEIQTAKTGRRIICGVGVDDDGIHPTRRSKRKLRAARHQNNIPQAEGLEEWHQLKTPSRSRFGSSSSRTEEEIDEVQKLARFWRLGKLPCIPSRPNDVDLGNRCLITSDPCYYLGLSTFTSGWRSCLKQPDGQYRSGVKFWLGLQGSRIAMLRSKKIITYGGVARRAMAARCLVHELESGELIYDRFYGGAEAAVKLQATLENHGVISVATARARGLSGTRVVGRVPKSMRSYFDSMKCKTISMKNKKTGRCKKYKIVVL